ncbi:hypothetical protein KSF_048580 [Reticulibacter mediterranei]|uniref:Uncharacterized protein n=1 Tax=Reticulibacter mediterranei TaxID=2778369 RepID=A0A8J3N410_9CHLR|nr:hypothetical protein KSF_048580 [Reticulibacter mediterranei]
MKIDLIENKIRYLVEYMMFYTKETLLNKLNNLIRIDMKMRVKDLERSREAFPS